MKLTLIVWLGLTLICPAGAAVVKITVGGTVDHLHVIEGPVFGYRSKQPVPGDLPFVLICSFDDEKGVTSLELNPGGQLLASAQTTAPGSSPGVAAVLRIGDIPWDFGESVRSEVRSQAGPSAHSYAVHFRTADRDNWISLTIHPKSGTPWTGSGDWRQSFQTFDVQGDPFSFSVDNGTVSAEGTLRPSWISVEGTALRGQALRAAPLAAKTSSEPWASAWKLAVPSALGGCVIERVTRTVVGTTAPNSAPITPLSMTYWLAWRVAPGSSVTMPPTDAFVNIYPPGSQGQVSLSGVARFYEGAAVPAGFHAGAVPSNGDRLVSFTDPRLPTGRATLPVVITARFAF